MTMQMPPPPLLPSFSLFLCLSLALLLPPSPASAVSSSSSPSFSLDFFPAAAAIAQLVLSGGASANATSGAVSMPVAGARVQYWTPIAASALRPGFSTYFSFAIPPAPSSSSLTFFLTPSASRSPPALALVFSARHVRLDLAGRTALQTETHHPVPTTPGPGLRLHAWIDYHSSNSSSSSNPATDTLHVRLAAKRIPTASHHPTPSPTPPLLSYPLHLPPVPILAGFWTSSGNCTLFTWAFRAAPNRMHSMPLNPTDLLTTPPPERVARAPALDRRYSSPWGAALSLLLAAAAGAMLTFIVLFLWYSVSKRRPVAPVEYPVPMHPSHLVYEKIVLVGVKDHAAVPESAGNN